MPKMRFLDKLKTVLIELYLPSFVLLLIIAVMYFGLGFAVGTPTPLRIIEIDMQPWWETSMYPALWAGDVILVEGVNPANLKVGDVILFKRPYTDKIIIHRVIEIVGVGDTRSFRTKGDNNVVADSYLVKPSDIVSRWTGLKIQFVGLPILLAQTDQGRIVVVALLIIITLYSLLIEEGPSKTEQPEAPTSKPGEPSQSEIPQPVQLNPS